MIKQTLAPNPRRVLEERTCPVCGKEFKSDENIISGSLTGDYARKYTFFAHSDCVCGATCEFLEKIGFSLIEDSGSWFDDGIEYIEDEN